MKKKGERARQGLDEGSDGALMGLGWGSDGARMAHLFSAEDDARQAPLHHAVDVALVQGLPMYKMQRRRSVVQSPFRWWRWGMV